MNDSLVMTLFGAVSTVLATIVIPVVVSLYRRVRRIERHDRLSWLYIRALIDHAYKYTDTTKHPLPDPPEGWLDDE